MSTIQELLREFCPNGVEHRPLGEISSFYSGLTGKTKHDFEDGNAPFLSYKTVFANLAIPNDVADKVRISPGEKQNAIHSGDIIFTGSSETQDEAGITCVATREPRVPLYLNSFCFGCRIQHGLLLPEFAKFLFRSCQLRKQIAKTASGVTRYNISKDRLARIRIPLPPLPVQEEIVRRLDAMQDVVEALENELALRRKQYEAVRKEVLDSLFVAEERTIGECCSIVNAHVKFQRSEYGKEGAYPIIDQGQDFICGYTDDASSIMDIGPCVLFGDPTRIVKYADFPFAQGADGLKILKAEEQKVTPRFLFHSLSSADIPNRGYNRHWTIVKDIRIPVPPLSVQKEIAKKLDTFDELVNVALPTEIAARRRAMEVVRERCFAALEAAG